MKFSLIICTYMRPEPLLRLLQSVQEQSLYPDEILVVDGSSNQETEQLLRQQSFPNLSYFWVTAAQRGLTQQRNFGIAKLAESSDIVCFLDDDTILERNYFQELLKTYQQYPAALGVGGYINNEVQWQWAGENDVVKSNEFLYDGWKRKEGSRFILRKKLGLDSNCPPGYATLFSHGRSVGFLPPSEKVYEVEMIMGGVASFRKNVFDTLSFSTYFEGYGLYEDADFSLRVAKKGKLYLNTAAKLAHEHAESGRPNQYQYGKMVVRNGWYVWRVKNPNPTFLHRYKWNAITLLLTLIRYTNVVTTSKRKEALTEAFGRTVGWWSLIFNKPRLLPFFK